MSDAAPEDPYAETKRQLLIAITRDDMRVAVLLIERLEAVTTAHEDREYLAKLRTKLVDDSRMLEVPINQCPS